MSRSDTVYVTAASLAVDTDWESPGCFHRSHDCAVAAADGGEVEELAVPDAEARGYTACGRCAG